MFWENGIYMHRDQKPVVALEVLACFGVIHPAAAKQIRYKAASIWLPMSMQTVASKWHFLLILAECPFKTAIKEKQQPKAKSYWEN